MLPAATPAIAQGRGCAPRGFQPPNRQIRSLVLCVDLVGSRPIWPAQVGWVGDLVGSRRILSDRLDDQRDDQPRGAGWADEVGDDLRQRSGCSIPTRPAVQAARPRRYPGLRALTITPVATWSWLSAGMVSRMTWMTSGLNSGYKAASSTPNGWWPPTQTSANPALWSLPAKTRSAIAPATHPAQAL